MTSLAELSASREMLVNLTLRELRGKYKRSFLGWSWSLLNPLATMLIFTLVFRFILKIPVQEGEPSGMKIFAFFLLCGLLSWNFTAAGMTGAMGTLIANANLIKKVYFPREILVVANVLASAVSLLIELTVLCVALMLFGNLVLPWLPILLFLVALQTLFVIGLGLMMSVLNVYFRDVQHFVSILLQMWFYATPIIYPLSLVHDATLWGREVPVGTLYRLNPMVGFVEATRDCLYNLRFPPVGELAYLTVVSLATLALGVTVFSRLEGKLAEEL
jgi:ABC-type polysaccharide/polyol phosphate export permease